MSPEVRAFVGDSILPEPSKPKRPARRKKAPEAVAAPSVGIAVDEAVDEIERAPEPAPEPAPQPAKFHV
ncbi:MAG TPA: hypothetical protein VIK32_02270, partial [Candidatus Limnocylindrales bacterium]